MKTMIIFAFFFIALFSFCGCAVMGEIIISMIVPPPPLPSPPDDDLQIIIIDQPTSAPPISHKRREIHTGRGHLSSNPSPSRNNRSNEETRDSGVQRNRETNSNSAPARTHEGAKETRNTGARRH